MKAYIVFGEWKGIVDPDVRGTDEKLFLAYSDEHAREKAREIANKEDFTLKRLVRVEKEGNVDISPY